MQVTPARCDGFGAGTRALQRRDRPASRRRCASSAAAARMIRSACVSVVEAMTTAPIARRRTPRRRRDLRAVQRGASAARPRRIDVDHILEPHARLPREIAAWILPIRPAPNSATSIVFTAQSSYPPVCFDSSTFSSSLYASAMNNAWHRQIVLVSERNANALPSFTYSCVLA